MAKVEAEQPTDPRAAPERAPPGSNSRRVLGLVGFLCAVAVAIALFAGGDTLPRLVDWVRTRGAWGALVFGLSYTLATVLLVPGSVMTLAAGFVYGTLRGTLVVLPAALLGATLAFSLARGRARPWVERRAGASPRFRAVDRAIGAQGARTVLLLRLSPVFPFSVLNYLLGLTGVKTWQYVGASALGMLPGTLLYAYLGSLVQSVAELASGAPPASGWASQGLFWGGLLATLVATVSITRAARRALARELDRPAGERS